MPALKGWGGGLLAERRPENWDGSSPKTIKSWTQRVFESGFLMPVQGSLSHQPFCSSDQLGFCPVFCMSGWWFFLSNTELLLWRQGRGFLRDWENLRQVVANPSFSKRRLMNCDRRIYGGGWAKCHAHASQHF